MQSLKNWGVAAAISVVLLLGTAQPAAHAQVVSSNAAAIAALTQRIAATAAELDKEVAELNALQGTSIKSVNQAPISTAVYSKSNITVSPHDQAEIDRMMDTLSDKLPVVCLEPTQAINRRLSNQIVNLMCLQNGYPFPSK